MQRLAFKFPCLTNTAYLCNLKTRKQSRFRKRQYKYEDLSRKYGIFPVVISLEVIEHCYYPRKFAKTFYDLLTENGIGIISTPYNGYLKYLALAVLGKMDNHLTALWDGGHIKFWSENTLNTLLKETGFRNISFVRVGRITALAKSMIAIVKK